MSVLSDIVKYLPILINYFYIADYTSQLLDIVKLCEYNIDKPLSSIFIFLSHCALVALQLRNPCRPSPAIRWLQKPNDIFIILKLCVTNHIPNYSVQLEKQIYYSVGNG